MYASILPTSRFESKLLVATSFGLSLALVDVPGLLRLLRPQIAIVEGVLVFAFQHDALIFGLCRVAPSCTLLDVEANLKRCL